MSCLASAPPTDYKLGDANERGRPLQPFKARLTNLATLRASAVALVPAEMPNAGTA